MIEQEPAPLKLPRKTGIPHSDFFFFDSEDSCCDAPAIFF
jgi:hypothetical protein